MKPTPLPCCPTASGRSGASPPPTCIRRCIISWPSSLPCPSATASMPCGCFPASAILSFLPWAAGSFPGSSERKPACGLWSFTRCSPFPWSTRRKRGCTPYPLWGSSCVPCLPTGCGWKIRSGTGLASPPGGSVPPTATILPWWRRGSSMVCCCFVAWCGVGSC